MSYRTHLWIFQIAFSHAFGSLSYDLWRRLFHRLRCSSGLRFASHSQPKFIMASLYPFVLLPALSFSLNCFSPSLVFTPSDVFIDYNHIPSWPFFSKAKQPSASGLLWEHRLSIPLFGLVALLCSHCRPKSLFLSVFSWPCTVVIQVSPHFSKTCSLTALVFHPPWTQQFGLSGFIRKHHLSPAGHIILVFSCYDYIRSPVLPPAASFLVKSILTTGPSDNAFCNKEFHPFALFQG